MKKFLLLVICILFGVSGTVYAQPQQSVPVDTQQDVVVLEKKLKNLEQKLHTFRSMRSYRSLLRPSVFQEGESKVLEKNYEKTLAEWGDTLFKVAEAKGEVQHISEFIGDPTERSTSSQIDRLETGDFIILKPKNPRFWTLFTNGYQHAVLVYDNNTIVHAPGINSISRKENLRNYLSSANLDRGVIAKMHLTNSQKVAFKNYIDSHFLNKPYPSVAEFPIAKYWMNKFYCTSLVWRAHYSSGWGVDLDLAVFGGPDIVYPEELIQSSFTRNYLRYITF